MEGKGRRCLNENGIMDFRRCGLNDSFCVRPGEEYIDRNGITRYNRYEDESSDILSVKKIDKLSSIDDIPRNLFPNRNGGFHGFGADPDERF